MLIGDLDDSAAGDASLSGADEVLAASATSTEARERLKLLTERSPHANSRRAAKPTAARIKDAGAVDLEANDESAAASPTKRGRVAAPRTRRTSKSR
jgi:hypothetical protein